MDISMEFVHLQPNVSLFIYFW